MDSTVGDAMALSNENNDVNVTRKVDSAISDDDGKLNEQTYDLKEEGLDHHALYMLIAPCDHGLNSETLVVVKEFGKDQPLTSSKPSTPLIP
ncbi:hypothetical protein OSB04_000060 [Centaurea solstitialis]|uniref:Uncharacterized protein n=1 Tax=Centaurea solstitialis TaxID=347529 RepID=A0AA38WTM4_9ASTR|nr:hypothetical protein OSB04_000060 [Centaurea solstitialis]